MYVTLKARVIDEELWDSLVEFSTIFFNSVLFKGMIPTSPTILLRYHIKYGVMFMAPY
jgi:hypothetical protein